MKLFFAGAEGNIEKFTGLGVKSILINFFNFGKNKSLKKHLEKHSFEGEIFIDSGAFSAWNAKKEITLEMYINWLRYNKQYITQYANLDVIGDAEATLHNQQEMEEQGYNPIPCFHFREDFKYLDYYAKKYDYIALGGMVGANTTLLVEWLNVIFTKYPKHKFHGFGVTDTELLKRYPWFSVDSTTWLMWSIYGLIMHEGHSISIKKISFMEREKIRKKCEERNIDFNLLDEEQLLREKYNICEFVQIQYNHNVKDFKMKQFQLESFFEEEQPIKETSLIDELREIYEEYGAGINDDMAMKILKHRKCNT